MSLSYADALDYLYGLINYEVQRPERYTPEVVSLDRPRLLMHALGDPQERYPIVHVTGTKGKGSVSAMTARVLQAAGLRVGLYSSPHLQDFRERFRINGELIEPEIMADLVARIRPHVEQSPKLTWFEVTTAIAFLYFAEANVDITVIEVGLGGRLDATNIVQKPLVATITSLSYDHTQILGNTLTDIAYEKGGIIKPGVPVVSASQADEALIKLESIAAERNAPLTLVGRDFIAVPEQCDEYGQYFTVTPKGGTPQRYWTPLIGEHQVTNAAVALATLHHVRAAGIAISEEAVHTGFRLVNWPGRFEIIRRSPWLVLDVAHNGASAEKLRDALTSVFPAERIILVFGAFTDKDVAGMFKALLPIVSHLILMQTDSPRSSKIEDLTRMAQEANYTNPLESYATASEAMDRAQALIGPNDLICVTGSLSMVGDVRNLLGITPNHAAYLDETTVQALQNMA